MYAMHTVTAMTAHAAVAAEKICPKAPAGAVQPVNDITGYILWGVIVIMGLAILTGIGAVAGGRFLSMPHASKVGIISICTVFVCALGLMILPGMLDSFMGNGCIGG